MLKQRQCILKLGMCAYSAEMCDKMLKYYCTLHNYFLDADEIGILQKDYVSCNYEDLIFKDCNLSGIPKLMHKLYRNYGELNQLDLSGAKVSNALAYNTF